MSGQSISRTHDGIPIYDGSPELLPLFREEALQYLMTYEHKKRYLVGPRLAKELQGTAKLATRNMVTRDPQWLSHPRGVYTLLQHLEDVIAKPSLPEASRFVMKFFYNFQRKRCESMTSWIARHAERRCGKHLKLLGRLRKSLGARTIVQGKTLNVGCHGVQLLELERLMDNKDVGRTRTFLMTMVD